MLKTMRQSFHHLKWTLYAVIAVFILGFVFYAGSSAGKLENNVVARVGGQQISAIEFDRMYRSQVERYRQMYQGNFSPELARALDLPRNVLDGMIDRILRREAAERLDLSVSDEELRRRIVSFTFFQEDGKFIGAEKYERAVRSLAGMTPEKFEADLRQDMLLEKHADLVRASVVVPDAEVAREFATRNDKASIEYILIPTTRLEIAAQPAEADLKAYLEKHRDRYRAPVQRRVKYLLVDRSRARSKGKPTEEQIRPEFEKRKDTLTVPEQVTASHILVKAGADPGADALARAKAENLAARVKAGGDFGKLADESTDDPSGKGTGGQLPPFSRGQMLPEFEQAVFAMEPGEIRGPIKTQFGYHVIKLVSKSPARARTLDEVRPQLQAELAEKQTTAEVDRASRELAEKLSGMRSASDEDLRKLQNDLVTFNTTEWAARGDAIPGIGANEKFSGEVWSTPVGKVSATPVTTARGPVFVKPSEERAAGVPPFEELKPRVEADWRAERRQKDALEQLSPVAQELASGTTLAQLAPRYEAEVKTTAEFAPGGPVPEIGTAPELSAAVFATPAGQAGPPVSAPNGYVLFRVLTKTQGTPEAMAAQKEQIRESIQTREAERLLRSYLQELRKSRKIEVNEELLASFLPQESGNNRRS